MNCNPSLIILSCHRLVYKFWLIWKTKFSYLNSFRILCLLKHYYGPYYSIHKHNFVDMRSCFRCGKCQGKYIDIMNIGKPSEFKYMRF